MSEDEAPAAPTSGEALPLEVLGSGGGLQPETPGLGRAGTGEDQGQAEDGDEGEDDAEGEEEDFQLELDEIGRPRVPEWVAGSEPEDLALALESVCFVLNRPVSLGELSGILGQSPQSVERAAAALAEQLGGRGLMLQHHRDQVQLVTRPQTAWAVQRALNPEKPARLSRPALETLAIVAYRQPVTRALIESIRGVNCEAVLESLERRGLIAEIGRAATPGQPRLFGTTLRFLQLVGLERIDQLPPLPGDIALPEEQERAWSDALAGAAGDEPPAPSTG